MELEAYQNFGVAGLFITMYLSTVWYLIKTLQKDREKEQERTKKMVEVLAAHVEATRVHNVLLEKLRETVHADIQQQRELIVYLKARGSGMRKAVCDEPESNR